MSYSLSTVPQVGDNFSQDLRTTFSTIETTFARIESSLDHTSGNDDVSARRVYDKTELLRIRSSAPGFGIRGKNWAWENRIQDVLSVQRRPLRKAVSIHGGDGSISRNSSHADSLNNPTRQPINPGGDFDWQKAKGFARFIKDHASPRHHRVTAGGRIVPAIPNTPPPTFHDAFLDAFLNTGKTYRHAKSHQSSNSFQHHHFHNDQGCNFYVGESKYTYPSRLSGLHPYLKIPPGFRVIQASSDGTIAIVIAGTTIYRCELMEDGQTSCKVAAQGAMLSTSPYAQPAAMHVMEETIPQCWHPAVHMPILYGDGTLTTNYPISPSEGYTTDGFQEGISWLNTKQRLEHSHTNLTQTHPSHLDQAVPASQSTSSTPNLYSGTYQQQLEKLSEALEGWMAMLMDAERVLCFPRVLGKAGIDSTLIKKEVILVKIDELSRKKQQLENRIATYNPGYTTRAGSESGYPESLPATTEIDNHEDRELNEYTGQYSGDATVVAADTRVLSPLAAEFIPQEGQRLKTGGSTLIRAQ